MFRDENGTWRHAITLPDEISRPIGRTAHCGGMESVDLIYNLTVLWSELGIAASEVWAEMDRRQALLGMAEKLPKDDDVEGSVSVAGQ